MYQFTAQDLCVVAKGCASNINVSGAEVPLPGTSGSGLDEALSWERASSKPEPLELLQGEAGTRDISSHNSPPLKFVAVVPIATA